MLNYQRVSKNIGHDELDLPGHEESSTHPVDPKNPVPMTAAVALQVTARHRLGYASHYMMYNVVNPMRKIQFLGWK